MAGIFIRITMELRKLILMVKLNGQTKNIVTLRMPLNTVMDTFTLLVMTWLHTTQKPRFISLILKGKKYGEKDLGLLVKGKNSNLFLSLLMEN